MMEIGGDVEMNVKSLIELQIPAEEVENIDALVSEGYYGCRSDAIRDIIRRGATYLRLRYSLPKGELTNDG
ncbi:MAG: ribbon-helix-helix domain-containing protein [Halobacteriota archaeon]